MSGFTPLHIDCTKHNRCAEKMYIVSQSVDCVSGCRLQEASPGLSLIRLWGSNQSSYTPHCGTRCQCFDRAAHVMKWLGPSVG